MLKFADIKMLSTVLSLTEELSERVSSDEEEQLETCTVYKQYFAAVKDFLVVLIEMFLQAEVTLVLQFLSSSLLLLRIFCAVFQSTDFKSRTVLQTRFEPHQQLPGDPDKTFPLSKIHSIKSTLQVRMIQILVTNRTIKSTFVTFLAFSGAVEIKVTSTL